MAGRFRVIAVVTVVLLTTACGWTQYAGNAGRTGFASSEGAMTVANAPQARVLWRANGGATNVTIADGFIFGGDGVGNAWPTTGGSFCSGTPRVCQAQWYVSPAISPAGDPAVSGTTLFVAGQAGNQWSLVAFDARGCGSPQLPGCPPLWTGAAGGPGGGISPRIAVGNGIVVLQAGGIHPTVFDAAGTRGCSTATHTCAPLFRLDAPESFVPAAMTDQLIFTAGPDGVDAFDARGVTKCTAGLCAPLFRLGAANPGGISLAGNRLFTVSGDQLEAFELGDAAACPGTLPTCAPTWTGRLLAAASGESPIVARDLVLVNSISAASTPAGAIEAFDLAGARSCSGAPTTCTRLWSTVPGSTYGSAHAVASANLLVVASSSGLPPPVPPVITSKLSFFDLSAVSGCTGTPRRCSPVAEVDLGGSTYSFAGRPALAAGLVVVPSYERPWVVGLP